MNPGVAKQPGPTVISLALRRELLDAGAGLACSSVFVLHRETILSASRAMFEVRGTFSCHDDYNSRT